MSFESELFDHLSVSAVTAFVGERITPLIIREGSSLPAITYTIIQGLPENSLDGFTSGLTRYNVQLDCWGTTHNAARALALVVRDRMNVAASGFKTVISDFPLLEDYEPDTKRYRRSIGCQCWHTEP